MMTQRNAVQEAIETQNLSLNYYTFWDRSTFLPFDQPLKSDLLLGEVWKIRQATFLGFDLKISEKEPKLYLDSRFQDSINKFLKLSSVERKQFTEYPPFRIWLRKSARIANIDSVNDKSKKQYLKSSLLTLGRITREWHESKNNDNMISGTEIQLFRYDVDPLIAESVPPSYSFPGPDKKSQLEQASEATYKFSFFMEVLTVALDRIKHTWPQAYDEFKKFVKIIIHLPDAQFRSCSAERYSGVILLSADDSSLLDLEESLIHEYGHQILYNVMEIDPLIENPSKENYKLPWSGSIRDFYGYFHAFYIYILLVHYFELTENHLKAERKRAMKRLMQILRGLVVALPDIEATNNFTLRGRELFEFLKEDVQKLKSTYKHLL